MSWDVVYEDGLPARMRWQPSRTERRCPRTWPHEPHGPWFTGEVTHAAEVSGFDCPGAPIEGKP